MKRPKIICHMMTSLDGKILTANWGKNKQSKLFGKLYEQIHDSFKSDAWMAGRVTMDKDFAKGKKPVSKRATKTVERIDYIADHNATTFAIAMDGSGKLNWDQAKIEGDHIIEVVTEKVPNRYLLHLQENNISYIFAGKKELDFNLAVEKLGSLFPIKTLMLEGGGHLNGSLLNEGLIDEISLLVLPIADGTPNSTTVFEVSDYLTKGPATFLKLIECKQMVGDVVWLKYKMK